MVLTKGEVLYVVGVYIGVSDGFLGDFSYRTHSDFYPMYCGLDNIDPDKIEGTTRERFVKILLGGRSEVQAKILRGVLERFPLDAFGSPPTRNEDSKKKILALIDRLEKAAAIDNPDLMVTSEFVERALNDAEELIKKKWGDQQCRSGTRGHAWLSAYCL